MSAPKTDEERARYAATSAAAGPAENVVSTACPDCHVRFALVAKFYADGWYLRCTLCGARFKGEPK